MRVTLPEESASPGRLPPGMVLRQQLGIPSDAERVIVFAESSHWDPNWMFTSEEYYRRFVRRNLDLALAELEREPRRIYSIECMFFLRLYWDRCPERRDAVRRLVNEGRLRMTGSGVTTADTLLPDAEAILRDLLIGQEWLRRNGMRQEPRLAYFTDSFGCSPALPSLLNAAGFDRTAITRVDGMLFPGCDLEASKRFPKPGSSAELLLKQQRTLDFLWRDRGGGEALCHWNAFTYGQGDLLAFRGVSRVYLFPLAFPDPSERNVARRVEQAAAQLTPYSRTPYLFCPIGFDFVPPIPDLVALIDRYNRLRYPTTGLWAVNAGLDDYLALIEGHRADLPVLELDPNPYWTGFYTARPSLKKRCRELVDWLLLAERLALLPENRDVGQAITSELGEAWWIAAASNHHDMITGTSPDRVVEAEQVPWLEQATGTARASVERLARPLLKGGAVRRVEQPAWTQSDGRVKVETSHYLVELSEEMGGAIVSARLPGMESPFLTGASNDLIDYRDAGGLWRMGHEFAGGYLREVGRASERPARLEVREGQDGLEISCLSRLGGQEVRRSLWFRADSPLIRCRAEGRAAARHTVTLGLLSSLAADGLAMDTPGGVVFRPLQKVYDPTFWPLHRWAHVSHREGGWGLVLLQRFPGAIACRSDGRIEWVALRNATHERAFGLLTILGNPAVGHEREPYAFDYALWLTRSGDWQDNKVPQVAHRLLNGPWSVSGQSHLHERIASQVATDREDVWVTQVKPAWRGQGLIVRLCAPGTTGTSVVLTVSGRPVQAAFLCDARERDIGPLPVQDGCVRLAVPGTIATVRLLCD